jgi:hypothetical protein
MPAHAGHSHPGRRIPDHRCGRPPGEVRLARLRPVGRPGKGRGRRQRRRRPRGRDQGCDADGIRKAVEQGASLTSTLPDSTLTPLIAALCKFGEPGWEECVELLLELGCPVDGVKKDPPIVACAAEDALGPKTLELLVAHGADVNAANREGTTAIFECVVNGRVKLARFLMQHGADPTIKDASGTSALDWVRKRYDEEQGFRSRTKYAGLLSVLTGQPVAKPEVPTLRPELQAENERFKRCLKARRVRGVPAPRSYHFVGREVEGVDLGLG